MFFALLLILFGLTLLIYKLFKPKTPNKYIAEHEKKIKDDAIYNEYLEWCKIMGENPADKNGFDELQMKEYMHYKKLMKYGIK